MTIETALSEARDYLAYGKPLSGAAVLALVEEIDVLDRECRERGQEIAKLKQGIAAATITLEHTACGTFELPAMLR